MTLGCAGAGERHDAGCIHIEAMDDERAGEEIFCSGCNAVCKRWTAAGYAEQATWFGNDKEVVVEIEDREVGGCWWGVGDWGLADRRWSDERDILRVRWCIVWIARERQTSKNNILIQSIQNSSVCLDVSV